MNTTGKPLYFVHISDTHFGPDRSFARHGHQSWPCARDLVSLINNLPCRPDFVMHTGDVTTNPDPDAYRLAAETFSNLDMPVYYVMGNHDKAVDIRNYLQMGSFEELGIENGLLSYRFDRGGYRFLVIDARAPDKMDPHGLLSEAQIAIIHDEVKAGGPPLLVFVHFPVFLINSPWFDENMMIINGERLHKELLPARDRLKGVFHGHLHMSRQTITDGILYSCVSSTFADFAAWPGVPGTLNADNLPGFNFVQLLPSGEMIIQNHTFPRPAE